MRSSTQNSIGIQPFIRRVRLKNYKSIALCDVGLQKFTVLVGRNGSGKSNFLDALNFVSDGLQTTLDHAFKSRGGVDAVRRISTGHPRNFTIDLDFQLPQLRSTGRYMFEITARRSGFAVKLEHLEIRRHGGAVLGRYTVNHGALARAALPRGDVSAEQLALNEEWTAQATSLDSLPRASDDRLYLVHASGVPVFRAAFDALASMGFYSLNPDAMRDFQNPDPGDLLSADGGNVASVVARLTHEQPAIKERIRNYLEVVVPGIVDFGRATLGPREVLEFKQRVQGDKRPWKFYATNMSDGTLRTLGVLVAALQFGPEGGSLVGIEEPETALHPAAAGALVDALREASTRTQVLVTCHSPELVDELDSRDDRILAVQSTDGTTELGGLDRASVAAISKHLYTPGELLKMDQLTADPEELKRQREFKFPPVDIE